MMRLVAPLCALQSLSLLTAGARCCRRLPSTCHCSLTYCCSNSSAVRGVSGILHTPAGHHHITQVIIITSGRSSSSHETGHHHHITQVIIITSCRSSSSHQVRAIIVIITHHNNHHQITTITSMIIIIHHHHHHHHHRHHIIIIIIIIVNNIIMIMITFINIIVITLPPNIRTFTSSEAVVDDENIDVFIN